MQEEKKKSRKEGDKARLAAAAARLGVLQRRLKDEKIPVIITFDGFDAAGKGLQISRLIPGALTCTRETGTGKRRPCTRFYGGLPSAARKRAGSPFLTPAGTDGSLRTGLTGIWEKERQKKAFRISGLLKNS